MIDIAVFDKVTDKIYMTDIETNEIVYANQSLLKLLGFQDIEEVKGQKCYKVLRGNDSPCECCTNHLLKEHEFYEWTTYNNLFRKHFANKDTIIEWKGKKCRLEIGSEIEKQNDSEIFYEKLGNEVLGAALKEDDIGEGIRKSIGMLGERMQVDRIYIFELDGDVSSNTYEWCAEGVHAEIDNLQNISNEMLAPWYHAFDREGEVWIEDLEAIKDKDPDIYEVLKPQGIQTLIAQPIYVKKQLRGFFGVDNIERRKMQGVSAFMKMIATYVADLIEKRDNRFHLERLSKYDPLTTLYNRKIAEHMINESLHQHGGTLLIIDLDNFKAVNDLFGHQQGDLLLQEVAKKMKSVCRESDIVFRLGGDEFGIYFISLVNEDRIISKCNGLLEALHILVEDDENRVQVSASIGVSEAPLHGNSFIELYAKADEKLYQAKDQGKNTYRMDI